MQATIQEKLKNIKLAIFDVDGVLTDGRLIYGENGETVKIFHVHDGLGLKRLIQHNVTVGIISGRDCQALRKRLADLGIEHAYLGQSSKIPALQEMLDKTGFSIDETSYMGDDLPDLEVMRLAGFSFAPANAVNEVKNLADWQCQRSGGNAAVREVCDLIINAIDGYK